jgi:hypothetical protein
VTEEELEELIADCPTLYHMAQRGSWESVKVRGLLSTSALLDFMRSKNLNEIALRNTTVHVALSFKRMGYRVR